MYLHKLIPLLILGIGSITFISCNDVQAAEDKDPDKSDLYSFYLNGDKDTVFNKKDSTFIIIRAEVIKSWKPKINYHEK